MSPDAAVAPTQGRHRLAFGATVACVAAALLVAVFPGWVIGLL
jgi:hypothetical protein